jgi:hypothetical protein
MHTACFRALGVNYPRAAASGWLAVVVMAAAGCDRSPFAYAPISGRITYEDGTPLPTEGALRLTFYSDAPPVDGKFYPRPGSAMPDKDGNFVPMTMRPGDGLVKGTHRVTVSYMERDTKGLVPKEYTLKDKTPLVADTEQKPFELKIPRP